MSYRIRHLKRGILTVIISMLCINMVAQVLPKFSTNENEVWYLIKFSKGNGALQDMGTSSTLLTKSANVNSTSQQWKLVGTQSAFQLISKNGNIIEYNGNRFVTKTSSTYKFKLVATENADYEGSWELQPENSTQSMNQWGGAGIDKELGLYSQNDVNNPLRFFATQTELPIFSTEGNEKWYFIRMLKGNGVIMEKGEGEILKTASSDPCNEQLWKLVGTQDAFDLINKNGRHVYCSGPDAFFTASSTKTSKLKLVATGSNTYAPAWEIHIPGDEGHIALNQYQGAGLNVSLSTWNKNDDNNPLEFIAESDMKYNDYKVIGNASYLPENKLTLWYRQPATTTNVSDKWMEYSLPIGNGQLGASIFGGVYRDEIQFNEKTLWSGRSTDNSSSYGHYENFGSVIAESLEEDGFGFGTVSAVQDYSRQLDLTNATASVQFKSVDKSVTYNRTYITSYPDGCIAVRYTATEKEKINLRFTMESGKPGVKATTTYANGMGAFNGKLETVSYAARFKVVPTGGTLTTDSVGVTVKGADEVMLIIIGGTDFDAYATSFTSGTSQLVQNIQKKVEDVASKDWSSIYQAHVADYQSFNNRVEFEIDGAANTMPTDELIKAYANRKKGTESYALMLEQLYFHYGRYLEIASSRGVDLPSNLQGIWNNSSSPAWNADIHSNINVQMNYWPAEATNLSEMHLPFLNYIHNMAINHTQWKKYAQDAQQTKGWTCYTENNIFGGVGSFAHNYVIANAWYCTHLWQHYRYTLDKDFLKQKALPTMWSACEFWLQRLKKDASGTYVCPNEYSPEHGPSEDGVAHAQQLVADLFANTLKGIEILGSESGISESNIATLKDRFEKLDKGLATETYDGTWGASLNGIQTGATILREWKTSKYTAGENGHRHMSHLMCLYPFNQVTKSSPYFQAAKNSLQLRGDASTGWSMGWKINLWARALDGNHAHTILELALRHHSVSGGGVYYNLYDSHSPFQIDGNFGACAGIAEMCLQSQTDTLQLLPALPTVWKKGVMKGLKAVGGFKVDQEWTAGKLTTAVITSEKGQQCPIQYQGIADRRITDAQGKDVSRKVVDNNTIIINTTEGGIYTIDFSQKVPDGISTNIADSNISIALKGNTIVAQSPKKVQLLVTDLAGNTLLTTKSAKATVKPSWGKVVIVKASTKTNSATTKLAINR